MEFEISEAQAVVGEFAARLRRDQQRLDDLNVFPVADSDTGANMVRTLDPITSALMGARDLAEAAALVEVAALDGRGNSGLIVGQFLAGFFSVSDGQRLSLERALIEGAQAARRAVATPVDGTMLTVADVAAASFSAFHDVDVMVFDVGEAVEATTGQLPVLAERGVVDSGAAGLQLFFESLLDVVDGAVSIGDDQQSDRTELPVYIECDVGLAAPATSDPPPVAHEVQFRVASSIVSDIELRQILSDLGTDVVVASSASELAAHVHVADPHAATAAISALLETRPGATAISYEVEAMFDGGAS